MADSPDYFLLAMMVTVLVPDWHEPLVQRLKFPVSRRVKKAELEV